MKPDYGNVGKGPWLSGPPPSVGWWPASNALNKDMLRWWDGRQWSYPTFSFEDASFAASNAACPQPLAQSIQWRDRADWWPARSRT